MRRETNFSNTVVEILRNSGREERQMMSQKWERENGILAMVFAKICAQKNLAGLPEIGD